MVRGYAPLAATNSSMRALRFFRTKYCSVVALPSLTSCVHFSSGSLIPNALSMAKIQAVDPQIVDRVALRRDRVARDVAGFSDNRSDLIECRGHH
jgi:hypothetical protein